jgi:hypothetical protein
MPKEKAMEYTPSSSNSLSAWKVLDYEVQMFLGTIHLRRLSFIGKEPKAQIVRNALVESSLLHTRILADIFLSRSTYPDDIHLRDLGFDNFEEDDTFSKEIDALDQAYGKSKDENSKCWIINKMLAHPTSQRSESYDYSPVFSALDDLITALINHIYSIVRRPLPFPFS